MDVQKCIVVSLIVKNCIGILQDISTCHDDFSLNPKDGFLRRNTFTWLAIIQYIHVTTGLPHQSKSPRVTLIQKQFVIGTAMDLLRLPKNYKTGNVIFGEYERDEGDCGLSRNQIKMGASCPPAYLEIPAIDIIPHPEYSRFGVGNSLALVKLLRPMKSQYMIPICLPSIQGRKKISKKKVVFLVDYVSSAPHEFDVESMAKKTVKLYTHKDCRRHSLKSKLGNEGVTHVLCTSGCGIRSGTPIVSKNPDGTFELIGVAVGSAQCSRRSMRRRLNKEPPLYIDVYPYTTWIINVITANELPMPYPQSFRLSDSGAGMSVHKHFLGKKKKERQSWRGRTYVAGNLCYKSKKTQSTAAFFYSENFEVKAGPSTKLQLIMKLSAGVQCTIVCARLILPNRLVSPTVDGIGGYNITLNIETNWFPYSFYYSLGLTGKNSTYKDIENWLTEQG